MGQHDEQTSYVLEKKTRNSYVLFPILSAIRWEINTATTGRNTHLVKCSIYEPWKAFSMHFLEKRNFNPIEVIALIVSAFLGANTYFCVKKLCE